MVVAEFLATFLEKNWDMTGREEDRHKILIVRSDRK
jgi:hypothetical protein